MKLRATILGSGSSGGVPRIGGHWGACDPAEPRNRRRRCSLLVEQWQDDPTQKTTVLVDTSPDMRDQLLDAGVTRIDGVLFTHDHADQCHGIDDLRMVAHNMRARVHVWMDELTARTLTSRFNYCFEQVSVGYPAILKAHMIEGHGKSIEVQGPGGTITAVPFIQDHGAVPSLGFRFGPFAYSADVVGVPDESFALLQDLECWIVDALRYEPHPTHAHVDMALEWLARTRAKQGILTNLHIDLDYRTLAGQLPSHVTPAYDGMAIEFDA